jgi:hypothetical protein
MSALGSWEDVSKADDESAFVIPATGPIRTRGPLNARFILPVISHRFSVRIGFVPVRANNDRA